MKKGFVIVVSGALLIGVVFCIYLILNPVVLKQGKLEVEISEQFDPKDNIRFVFLGDRKEVEVKGKVDISKLGTYSLNYQYKNKIIEIPVEVVDTVEPKVQTKDYSTDTIEEINASQFVESVEDKTEVKFSFDKEVPTQEGKYALDILAEDQGGNVVSKKVKLTRKKDDRGPKIDLIGKLVFVQNETVDLQSLVSIQDDFDPKPTLKVTSDINFSNPGQYEVTWTAEDRSGNISNFSEVITIKSQEEMNKKIVYLTFDDGPSQNTKKILDILDKYDAKATFFVTGTNPSCNNYIQEAYNRGHSIGLHTYTHDYASVYSSVENYFNDLDKIGDMVESLTGHRSNIIRFPGGSSNTISANYTKGIMSLLVKEVRNRGYQYFDWNCDSTDASGNNVPVDQLVSNATSASNQYINILMHDTDAKDTTVEALPKILEHYKKQGYVFRKLEKDSYAPHHGINNG